VKTLVSFRLGTFCASALVTSSAVFGVPGLFSAWTTGVSVEPVGLLVDGEPHAVSRVAALRSR